MKLISHTHLEGDVFWGMTAGKVSIALLGINVMN